MKLLTKSLLLSLLLLTTGCKTFSPAFVKVSQDHKILTEETNKSIIGTLKIECEGETGDRLEACLGLIERLNVITRQANVMEQYILHTIDEETLMDYITGDWK